MQRLELTLDHPAENLALDEAVLDDAESRDDAAELLRIWEPRQPMVVVGRSSPVEKEVNLDYCQRNGIGIYRRASGGQTILTGPGCLMYCVLLSYRKRPQLRMLDEAHRFVIGNLAAALKTAGVDAQHEGTCDLTIQGRKVSGNSLRCKRNFLIYHGTLLYDLPIDLIQNALGKPVRQPEYRNERTHEAFLNTIDLDREPLRRVLIDAFKANSERKDWPKQLTNELVAEKYSRDEWNFRH